MRLPSSSSSRLLLAWRLWSWYKPCICVHPCPVSVAKAVEEMHVILMQRGEVDAWQHQQGNVVILMQRGEVDASQATTMDRHIGPSTFQIPAGSLTVFFVGSILLTVPVYDRVVVPAARRLSGNPHGLTPLQRIGAGLALSVTAMAAAALTEIRRLGVARRENAPADGGVVPMSVFWLVPQFLLVGAGEAFTYIGQLDFFLRECPKGMKTMSTGLFLSTLALGFFFSSALVAAVHRVTGDRHAWIADDLNKGRLDYFYWLLAAICLVNMLVYLVAARWYKYKAGRSVNDDAEVCTH